MALPPPPSPGPRGAAPGRSGAAAPLQVWWPRREQGSEDGGAGGRRLRLRRRAGWLRAAREGEPSLRPSPAARARGEGGGAAPSALQPPGAYRSAPLPGRARSALRGTRVVRPGRFRRAGGSCRGARGPQPDEGRAHGEPGSLEPTAGGPARRPRPALGTAGLGREAAFWEPVEGRVAGRLGALSTADGSRVRGLGPGTNRSGTRQDVRGRARSLLGSAFPEIAY